MTRRALVVGQGTVGRAAAGMLLSKGWSVDACDRRLPVRKQLAWGVRQSFLDALARIDPNLAGSIDSQGVSLDAGSTRVAPGMYRHKSKPSHRAPDARRRLPVDYRAMSSEDACFLVNSADVDRLLKHHLSGHPRYRFAVTSPGVSQRPATRYDLVVHATGGGSVPWGSPGVLAPKLRQISGVVHTPALNEMRRGVYSLEGQLHNAAAVRKPGQDAYWVVCDAPVESDAAETLEVVGRALFDRDSVRVTGPLVGQQSPRPFTFTQRLNSTALPGDGSVLIGDAVGNGHWLEGGGAQVGVVLHLQALSDLVDDEITQSALSRYSAQVTAASAGWVEGGLRFSYGELDLKASAEPSPLARVDA